MLPIQRKIAVLTGAGISAESGIKTFRDSGGLWEDHNIEDVASIRGWNKNPELVIDFYNKRRTQLGEVVPNAAHFALKTLEQKYDVQIITQNVDDLHERGGSTKILHLHGELTKVRSVKYSELIYNIGYRSIKIGDKCERGAQLRPHIVWFGEEVPLLHEAAKIIENADILMIIGTSLQVYPAAGLMHFTQNHCITYIVDPAFIDGQYESNIKIIKETAGRAIPRLVDQLMLNTE